MKKLVGGIALTVAFSAGFVAHGFLPIETVAQAQSNRVFELRTYTAADGKLQGLSDRFRDHTMALFKKHGMINVLYTHPLDADKGAGHTLIYVLAHSSVEAAKKSFDEFRADPDWVKARDASEANGKLLVNPPDSIFLTPTDFSKLK